MNVMQVRDAVDSDVISDQCPRGRAGLAMMQWIERVRKMSDVPGTGFCSPFQGVKVGLRVADECAHAAASEFACEFDSGGNFRGESHQSRERRRVLISSEQLN